ncbi:MAG: hypothetical protein JXB24_01405 [Bacteroidales bacterium]|jgi:ABC-type methionine transport system permease subunit|nr:hypothetical protein [Bacteroidales bacterium]
MEVVNPSQTKKTVLPNASSTLVLGILSLVLGCGFGLILGIIGLIISKEGKQLYEENPDAYSGFANLNAGRILCIIGIVLNGVAFMVFLFWILGIAAIVGTVAGLEGL